MLPKIEIWKDTFRVNNATADDQEQSKIIGLSNGNFVVVWTDDNDTTSDAFGTDIMGQLYDPFGAQIGGEMALGGARDQRDEDFPSIAATDDGGYVLTNRFPAPGIDDVMFYRFDADGAPVAPFEKVVSDLIAGSESYEDQEIVFRPDGTSIVTYRRVDGNDEDLVFITVDENGNEGIETLLRSDENPGNFANGDPDDPTAAVLNNGSVVVAYREQDGNAYAPEFNIIAANGAFNAGLFIEVDDDDPMDIPVVSVDVAALTDGGFVVTWLLDRELRGRVFNSQGEEQTDMVVLEDSNTAKLDAHVIGLKDGTFLSGWINDSHGNISMQIFNANGSAGSTIQKLPLVGVDAKDLDLSLSADGRVLVTWTDISSGGDENVYSAIVDPRHGTVTAQAGVVTTASPAGSKINGSAVADVIYGNDGGDDINGLGGSDTVFGGDGADDISGSTGNDMLYGGDGDDDLSGNAGIDILQGAAGDDTLNGGSNNDRLTGDSGKDVIKGGDGNDKLFGGTGADKLKGGSGKDTAKGAGGADKLFGGGSNDKLLGGKGDDTLKGDGGKDTLKGGKGKDTLNGGKGADKLKGEGGADSFVYKKASDSTSDNRDVIVKFQGGKDEINLKAIDADTTSKGNQAFDFIGRAQFEDAGDLRLKNKGKDVFVQGDRNGDGKVDFEIKLDNPSDISGGDFIL